MSLYEYHATVIKIVDGDTVDLNVDLGFRIWNRDRFRLLGINAPEVVGATHDAGIAAKQHLEQIMPIDSAVVIHSEKPVSRDKYGRWLARLFLGDKDINQAMIDDGFAVEYNP